MLGMTETIDKDKVRVSIYFGFASYSGLLLVPFFFQKCVPDGCQHRDFAFPCFGFRRVYITVASINFVPVIHQRMVDVDNTFFKVNITPSQPNSFANPHPCSKHYSKDWMPMLILGGSFEKIQK